MNYKIIVVNALRTTLVSQRGITFAKLGLLCLGTRGIILLDPNMDLSLPST
jgi:hypothetical protein